MTTFDDRERGYENAFAREQEALFRATAQRNRAIGLWAAEKLGHTGDTASAYAKTVVAAGVARAGDATILAMIEADLRKAGVIVAGDEIARLLSRFQAEAIAARKT